MSEQPQGQGWWLASDGKWYPPPAPEQQPPPLWQPGAQQGPPSGYVPYQYPRKSGVNGWAIASLVCALFGAGIGSILALVFGYRARREIIMSGNRQGGRGLATAGIILGWIGLLAITVLFFIALMGGVRDSNNY